MPALTGGGYLRVFPPQGAAHGLVLVLHGGRAESVQPTQPWQSAVLRMLPFVRAVRRSAPQLAVAQLRYQVRGWNGSGASVPDARQALSALTERFGQRPIALIGHSLGGRTALRVADVHGVEAVAALAPWLPLGEPVADVRGRRLLLVHGLEDRVTDPRATAAWAARARAAEADVGVVLLRGEGHGMLRRARLWHQLAASFVVTTLTGQDPIDGLAGHLVRRTFDTPAELVT